MKDLKPVTINPKALTLFAEKAGKLTFKKEAETELLKLLEMQKWLDNLVDQVKEQIAKSGNQTSTNFRGVIGEKVKAIYRRYGEKYGYRRDEPGLEPFLKSITYFKVDSGKVDAHLKEVGEMPDGIYEKERSPQISFTVKDEKIKS